MHSHSPTPPTRWGSLSLRLTAVFVAVLVTAAFAVGYLFDRGRTEAVERREREQLRLDAERGADEVDGFVRRLRADVLFLADTPPIHGIRRALEAGGTDRNDPSTLQQWTERLQQIFLAFGAARPEYFQLRFIGAPSEGRELVRVDRTEKGLIATPPRRCNPRATAITIRRRRASLRGPSTCRASTSTRSTARSACPTSQRYARPPRSTTRPGGSLAWWC